MKTRLIALLAAVMLLVVAMPALALDADAPVVTIMFPSANIPMDNSPVLNAYRELCGVNIQTIILTYDEYATKLPTMIAGGDLPDVFLSNNYIMTGELKDAGIILPLDELLEKEGQDILETKMSQLTGCCTMDGKIWGIPVLDMENSAALAIRQDWLDNLGLEVPTTLDEYYDVLYAFTYNDPNQNGEDDTIGLGAGGLDHIFGAYGIANGRPMLVDGEVVPSFLHPNYVKALTFLNKLYADGLYEPEYATIEWMTMLGKLWNGIYGAFEFNPNGTTQNWIGRYTEDPKPTFVHTVIRGEDGMGGTVRTIMDTSYAAVINAKTENPEACMKVINVFVSKEGDLLSQGIEGVHIKWLSEVGGKYEILEPYASDAAKYREEGVVFGNFMSRPLGIAFNNLNEVTVAGKNLARENNLEDAYLYTRPAIESEVGTLLDSLISEACNAMITCPADQIEEIYNQYVELYMTSGGDKWIEQATEIYAEQQ